MPHRYYQYLRGKGIAGAMKKKCIIMVAYFIGEGKREFSAADKNCITEGGCGAGTFLNVGIL